MSASPAAKRLRQEVSSDGLDTSLSFSDCESTSSSTESMELEDSLLDPQLEADMEQYRKPDASYIELIAKAIMESPGKKLRLQDIYDTLEKKYLYFTVADPGWKNSIRHNLSLHECFYKTERCGNGKGHYWSIQPIHMQDFMKGDFRRKTVKARARQLHQQQQQQQQQNHQAHRFQEVPDVGAAVSPTIPGLSPSILSPIGHTHFHFPAPFGIPATSPPQGCQSTIPPSPTLPCSPSLMQTPTGGIFFTSFPMSFLYGSGPYPLSPSFPISPSSSGLCQFPPPSLGVSPSSNSPYSLPSLTTSSTTAVPNQFSHLPPMTAPITTASSQLQVSGSFPTVPSRPPVLPPVCCINSLPDPPSAGYNRFGTGIGTVSGPNFSHLQDTVKASSFSIDDILSSQ